MRFTMLVPLVLSFIAFILSLLCILAGHKPGFMEDYHIAALNTSTLGHNLFGATTTSPATPASTASGLDGILDSLGSDIDNITSSIENDLNGIVNSLADDLSRALGIKQWYSLHMMDGCEGFYAPNATTKGASYNVTNCTSPVAMYRFNPTQTIQRELADGGLNITLADLNYPSDIQKGINELNDALDATFVLYCIGISASGLAMIGALFELFTSGSRLISLGNWGIASLASTVLTIASSIVTVAQDKLVTTVNNDGNDIGLYAYKGGKFLAITWVAAVAMMLASSAWVVEFCLGKMKQKRSFKYDAATRAPTF